MLFNMPNDKRFSRLKAYSNTKTSHSVNDIFAGERHFVIQVSFEL